MFRTRCSRAGQALARLCRSRCSGGALDGRPLPRRAGLCLLLCLWLAAFAAQAGMRVLAPGQVPVLGGNEGLLLVAIDSSIELDAVRLARVDRALTGDALRHIPGGRSYRLYVAPAGRYAWRSADVAGVRLPLAQDRELAFTVAPGVLSYVGDLVFRPVDGVAGRSMRASATLANRSLAAIDWLEYHHPRVLADHRLHFAGHYPDPFPEFYANERGIAATPARAARRHR